MRALSVIMDFSPKTKESIVDINIHEESHVEEILRELVQRFGDKESHESLKNFLIKFLEQEIEKEKVLFYEFDYINNSEVDVSVEYGLECIQGGDVWESENQPKLHIYRNNT